LLKPRDYQIAAVNALFEYWRAGGRSGLIVIPTGGGKSLVQSMIIKALCDAQPEVRILALTHRKELVEQNEKELLHDWPEAPTGVYQAKMKRKEINAQILFASIQSLAKHIHKLDPPPRLVLVDEAHLISTKEATQYRQSLETLRLMYPNFKLVGLTATPYRFDTGWLHTGPAAVFDSIIFEVSVAYLIENGYLCKVVSKAPKDKINLDNIKHRGGEFVAGDLQDRMMEGDNTAHAVAEIIHWGAGRSRWLVFATGIEHGEQVLEEFNKHGEPATMVTGSTPAEERQRIIESFRAGIIKILINVEVFTTGFNVKGVDLIALLRPTESPGLYVQMVGRGTRNAPGKKYCLVLDYAGNVGRHGPIDAVIVRDKTEGKGGGEAPVKECPECYSIIYASAKDCPDCGYRFPDRPPQISAKASTKAILTVDEEPQEYEVDWVQYDKHPGKNGKPDSVKVTYFCGIQTFREWIFPEAANKYFYNKWCANAGIVPPYPETAEEFCFWVIVEPERILVKKDGKYHKVIKSAWKAQKENVS
jgi:DNA repair protein RadD